MIHVCGQGESSVGSALVMCGAGMSNVWGQDESCTHAKSCAALGSLCMGWEGEGV